MIKVLFICHGNICRSPMAEFAFMKMIQDAGMEDCFEIASAATSSEEIWHGVGNPVYPPAKEELARHGIFCDGKRAVQLTKDDYGRYDYLIGMERWNLRNMQKICGGDPERKMSLLLDYADRHGDISDPWYTGDFKQAYEDIERGCKGLMAFFLTGDGSHVRKPDEGRFS